MKKLFLILFVIVSSNLNAQYITNYAKNVNSKDVDGYYYHLPRNILRLDFEIEKEQLRRGKYSAFAKEMLNTDNYIKENQTIYRIKSVTVNTLVEADPNHVFFISSDEKSKDNLNLNLELTSDGIIHSFGYKEHNLKDIPNIELKEDIVYNDDNNEYNYILIRDIEEDEEFDSDDDVNEENNKESDLSEKDIAISIINEIKKLRVAYFDLITGFQEVNYGNTFNYMIEQIRELEDEYMSMFLGNSNKHIYTKTFYIIPEDGKNTIVLGKFSNTDGFNTKSGETIKVNFVDSSIGSNVNKLSKDDIENTTYSNKLFYRNPAHVTMQIMIGDNSIFEDRLSINQLGDVLLIPMNKMKLVFDTNTGQILSVIRE